MVPTRVLPDQPMSGTEHYTSKNVIGCQRVLRIRGFGNTAVTWLSSVLQKMPNQRSAHGSPDSHAELFRQCSPPVAE